jgi:hypothetical protein
MARAMGEAERQFPVHMASAWLPFTTLSVEERERFIDAVMRAELFEDIAEASREVIVEAEAVHQERCGKAAASL